MRRAPTACATSGARSPRVRAWRAIASRRRASSGAPLVEPARERGAGKVRHLDPRQIERIDGADDGRAARAARDRKAGLAYARHRLGLVIAVRVREAPYGPARDRLERPLAFGDLAPHLVERERPQVRVAH